MEKEIWKDVVDYEGYYEVSNLGNFRSKTRVIMSGGHARTRIGKPKSSDPVTKKGYRYVTFCRNGVSKKYLAHRLVAKSFLPNPENKETVNHKDGVKTNNKLSNLEWATKSENLKHAYRTGLAKGVSANKNGNLQGEKVRWSKLNAEKVKFIRHNSYKNGGHMNHAEMGRMFGVDKSTVNQVVNRESWKHVD